MMTLDMDKSRREVMRWWLLQALQFARPVGTTVGILEEAIKCQIADVTTREIKLQLDYLEGRDLIELDKTKGPNWHAKLTRFGIDIVEYTVPVEPGIARPERAWD